MSSRGREWFHCLCGLGARIETLRLLFLEATRWVFRFAFILLDISVRFLEKRKHKYTGLAGLTLVDDVEEPSGSRARAVVGVCTRTEVGAGAEVSAVAEVGVAVSRSFGESCLRDCIPFCTATRDFGDWVIKVEVVAVCLSFRTFPRLMVMREPFVVVLFPLIWG